MHSFAYRSGGAPLAYSSQVFRNAIPLIQLLSDLCTSRVALRLLLVVRLLLDRLRREGGFRRRSVARLRLDMTVTMRLSWLIDDDVVVRLAMLYVRQSREEGVPSMHGLGTIRRIAVLTP